MDLIQLDKEELLQILHENRDKHRDAFEHALAGYKKALLADLNAMVYQLDQGKIPDVRIRYARPADHTRDYDRVIQMVQMHQGDYFSLEESDFAQFVRDDWAWKRQWVSSNSGYASAKFAEVYGVEAEEDYH